MKNSCIFYLVVDANNRGLKQEAQDKICEHLATLINAKSYSTLSGPELKSREWLLPRLTQSLETSHMVLVQEDMVSMLTINQMDSFMKLMNDGKTDDVVSMLKAMLAET